MFRPHAVLIKPGPHHRAKGFVRHGVVVSFLGGDGHDEYLVLRPRRFQAPANMFIKLWFTAPFGLYMSASDFCLFWVEIRNPFETISKRYEYIR